MIIHVTVLNRGTEPVPVWF